MSDWWMMINRTSNGYIVTCNDNDIDAEEGDVQEFVIEDKRDSKDYKIETGLELLSEVKEHFDLSGSDHDTKRLRVEIIDRSELPDEGGET